MSGEDIFVLARRDIIRGHRFKNVRERFSLECRRKSFALRVASIWNSLRDDVVARETVGTFKRSILQRHFFFIRERNFF